MFCDKCDNKATVHLCEGCAAELEETLESDEQTIDELGKELEQLRATLKSIRKLSGEIYQWVKSGEAVKTDVRLLIQTNARIINEDAHQALIGED